MCAWVRARRRRPEVAPRASSYIASRVTHLSSRTSRPEVAPRLRLHRRVHAPHPLPRRGPPPASPPLPAPPLPSRSPGRPTFARPTRAAPPWRVGREGDLFRLRLVRRLCVCFVGWLGGRLSVSWGERSRRTIWTVLGSRLTGGTREAIFHHALTVSWGERSRRTIWTWSRSTRWRRRSTPLRAASSSCPTTSASLARRGPHARNRHTHAYTNTRLPPHRAHPPSPTPNHPRPQLPPRRGGRGADLETTHIRTHTRTHTHTAPAPVPARRGGEGGWD